MVGQGAAPGAVVTALARELHRSPAVLVLEDLRWADEATLDVLRLVARRIEALPALVLATYRDDELHVCTRCGSRWVSCPWGRRIRGQRRDIGRTA